LRHSRAGILGTVALAALFMVVIGNGVAIGDDESDAMVTKGKALYRSAAYDEALNVLASIEGPEAMLYRALCLLATDRTLEARVAAEWLIRHAPTFTPEQDLPPRFISLFKDARTDILPDVVRALFAAARENFDSRSYADARLGFDEVAALASDAAIARHEDVGKLGLEAADYIRQIDAAVAQKAELVAGVEPLVAGVEPLVADAAPALAPPVPSVAPRRTITAPVVLRQTLPPWPETAGPRVGLGGAVRVVIGIDGRVRRASIERPINPQFDRDLLAAARSWIYTPAMMDGQPIDIEKVIEIKLR
jgi:TonB family protein